MRLEQVSGELSGVNLLINLLVRFPEILTAHYNLTEAVLKLSFMLRLHPEQARYKAFKKCFSTSLKAYYDMLRLEPVAPKIHKKPINNWTLLQVIFHKKNIFFEEINLVGTLILNEFKKEIITDTRENGYLSNGKKFFEEDFNEDFIKCLLPEKKKHRKENLFAFREEGKVYIFDK